MYANGCCPTRRRCDYHPILWVRRGSYYVGAGFGMGPLAFVIAAPLVAAGTYTTMSAAYGFKETAKCRATIDARPPTNE